jgi:hypothetical protein
MGRSVDIHDAVIYRFSVIGVTDTQPEMFIVPKAPDALDTRGM